MHSWEHGAVQYMLRAVNNYSVRFHMVKECITTEITVHGSSRQSAVLCCCHLLQCCETTPQMHRLRQPFAHMKFSCCEQPRASLSLSPLPHSKIAVTYLGRNSVICLCRAGKTSSCLKWSPQAKSLYQPISKARTRLEKATLIPLSCHFPAAKSVRSSSLSRTSNFHDGPLLTWQTLQHSSPPWLSQINLLAL